MVCAQIPAPAPAPAQPPQPESGPDVDLLHHFRRSTVSLGLHQTVDGKEHFVTIGSAVVVLLDEHHACLLTAKHVLFNPEKGYTPTMLFVRVPQSEPRDADDLGVPLPLIQNGRPLWKGADDADLAVAAIPPQISAYKDLHGILISDFGGEDDVYQGASVAVFGYPELLGPDYQTTPIARAGIIAWTDPNGRLDHTFLVDANVFNGNSGGTVFHLPSGMTKTGSFAIGGTPKLIGIISKDAYEEAPVHAGATPAGSVNPLTGDVTPVTAQVLNIGGIGIVEPISKAKKLVLDFLDPYH